MLNLYVKTKSALIRFRRDEEGATAIEYGLFAALIAAGIVAVVSDLGTEVKTGFVEVCQALSDDNPCGT
ncbi:Flp family type IVb pilin [Tritonibacter mobilis]|uniref:Flp family type IVb pilin n=1 Tax=Tritonibacter mobilis TaxID=379347 RepID=UPI0014038CD2|nr:Flp family type IVb pilin [Tritonibacter mobilis]NHM20554.1 Flp family type IVb pilin [Tritonibacter mobilis]NHM24716.1 Flp family type IVb pilin [Tritonibacter mobilis]